jgi:transposase
MTVREVAVTLGVHSDTIRKHIRKLYPDLMQHGKTTYLTEEQVYIIKKYMKQTDSVKNAMTEYDAIEDMYKLDKFEGRARIK